MKDKKIGVIGAGKPSKAIAMALAMAETVRVSGSDLANPEPFIFSSFPRLVDSTAYLEEPVHNHKKHLETCAKNRKKRKSKKKRK